MKRYYITDRHHAGGMVALLDHIRRHLNNGVSMIQIREKDLTARELVTVLDTVLDMPNPRGTKILVNSRADVALACYADGLHLPADAISPGALRLITPADFLIGVSCHSGEEVRKAEIEGADFAVYGPVFAPGSKKSLMAPKGLGKLKKVCASTVLPVYALGGIEESNAGECVAAGAAGVAGISMFQT